VEIAHSTSGVGSGGDAGVAVATPSRRRRGAGGDRGGMAAQGCHGTTRAKPRQLGDWEAVGVGIWRSVGARWQRAETLAAGGARHSRRRRRRANQLGGGVDPRGLVSLRTSATAGVVGARRSQQAAAESPGQGWIRERGRQERSEKRRGARADLLAEWAGQARWASAW
jgi:hypothetical protein